MQTDSAARKTNNKPVTDDRAAAITMLRAEGMKTKEIAATLGLAPSTIYQANHHLKKTGVNAYLTPKRLKSAVKVVDTFMQGKPIGRVVKTEVDENGVGKEVVVEEGIFPKDTTIKDCAMSVLDRQYPKKEDTPTTSISFTKIDLTVYQAIPATETHQLIEIDTTEQVENR